MREHGGGGVRSIPRLGEDRGAGYRKPHAARSASPRPRARRPPCRAGPAKLRDSRHRQCRDGPRRRAGLLVRRIGRADAGLHPRRRQRRARTRRNLLLAKSRPALSARGHRRLSQPPARAPLRARRRRRARLGRRRADAREPVAALARRPRRGGDPALAQCGGDSQDPRRRRRARAARGARRTLGARSRPAARGADARHAPVRRQLAQQPDGLDAGRRRGGGAARPLPPPRHLGAQRRRL